MATGPGTGTTVVFTTGTGPACVLSFDGPTITRSSLETTCVGNSTGFKTFLPADLYKVEDLELTVLHSAAFDPLANMLELETENTITINWAGSGSAWVIKGFVTEYGPSDIVVDGNMEATMTIQGTAALG
jgi:hypothetical protein